jgi:hypothetical protein
MDESGFMRKVAGQLDGVSFGFDGDSVQVSQKAYSIFIAREQWRNARIAELDRDRNNLLCDREQLRAELAALKAAQARDSDGMCNEENPSNRCVCREEFGYRVCGATEVKS